MAAVGLRPGRVRRAGLFGLVLCLCGAVSATAAGTPSSRRDAGPTRVLAGQISRVADWASGEGWVVADPRDPSVLTAAWTSLPYSSLLAAAALDPGPRPIRCGVASSRDGGKTWSEDQLPFQAVGLPTNVGGCADPSLAVGRTGTVYALFNGGSLTPGAGTSAATLPSLVTLNSSHDGGRTWGGPTKVWSVEDGPGITAATGSLDLAFDRPYLMIDPVTSTLYASVSDDAVVQRIVMASHDHGRTWGPARPLDPNDQSVWGDTIGAARGVLAAVYTVDPSSLTYLASPERAVDCTRTCAVFETSTDDGATWARHVLPAPVVVSGQLPTVPGVEVAVDPSRGGRFAVLVPVTSATTDVWTTSDSGRSWKRSFGVTATADSTLAKTWVAFGPTGALGVTWRNVHADGSHDVFATVSADGGRTFGAPIVLTPGPAPPDVAKVPVGDDCACNLFLDRTYLYATWADARSGQRQVWFARYRYAPDATRTPATPRPVRKPDTHAAAPTGSLAATGIPAALTVTATALLLGALIARRHRRRDEY